MVSTNIPDDVAKPERRSSSLQSLRTPLGESILVAFSPPVQPVLGQKSHKYARSDSIPPAIVLMVKG